jgi:hypothetical protein
MFDNRRVAMRRYSAVWAEHSKTRFNAMPIGRRLLDLIQSLAYVFACRHAA